MNDHVVMPMLSIASTSTGWFSHVAVENVGPVSLCRESPADVNTATSSDCVHSSVATCAEAKAAPVKREARSIFQNLNGIRVMYKGYKQATHSHQCDDCILDQLPKNMKLKLSPKTQATQKKLPSSRLDRSRSPLVADVDAGSSVPLAHAVRGVN